MASDETPKHLWVNGIVAVRDGQPYIQLSNENGMLAQLSMSDARQYADDIIQMCARTEADAMLIRFLGKMDLPKEAAAVLMNEFRDYRAELDADRGRVSGGPDREDIDGQ